MRFEESCTLSMPRKVVWDFLIDPRTWPLYWNGMVELVDADRMRWEQPGDQMRFVYRLFGRHLEGSGELLNITPSEYVRVGVEASAVGTLIQEWFYEDIDEESMRLRVAYETEEPTSLFGKLVDRTVLPTTLRKDLAATMRHIEELFAYGLPEV